MTDKKETAKNIAKFAGDVAVGAAVDKVKEGLLIINIIAGIVFVPLFLIVLVIEPIAAIFMAGLFIWGMKRKRDRRNARIKRYY